MPDAANVVFANDEEAARLELGVREVVVVTHGPDGASVNGLPIEPTGDTETGAGDRLAGRFVASLL